MTINMQNINQTIIKLNSTNVSAFQDINNSYKEFVSKISIESFRKIENLQIDFIHPISVISGANTIGKTSLLILLACSHENFMRHDSTSPSTGMREHTWNDMISFTSHENATATYQYSLRWRVGTKVNEGTGKRTGSNSSWSGLAKKSTATNRINAKIRGREVRLIDLERILPSRSFSNSLFRKANTGSATRLHQDIEQAFQYLFECGPVEIYEIASHINKKCFLIERSTQRYSSYNAASGEESALYLLSEIITTPKNSLILIDEIEAGFHPSIQRRIAELIQYFSWRDKKQFIITTHSPTFASAFSPESRIFIDGPPRAYNAIPKISSSAMRTKMDSVGHPLVRLYCEDELAKFLIQKAIMSQNNGNDTLRILDIITSGPVDQVDNDYKRHKRNYTQYRNKIGYCAIADGDYYNDPRFSGYIGNLSDFFGFIFPHVAPEKFLVSAYLSQNTNPQLQNQLTQGNHHGLFVMMVSLGLATDEADARNTCYECFKLSPHYAIHNAGINNLVESAISHFSN